MKNPVFQALAEAARGGEPAALGIISAVKGSSPQKIGAKALFYSDGRILGTLGGGCLEAEIQQRAIQSLSAGQSATFDLLLDHDFGWDDGLICGGKVFGLILPNATGVGPEFWARLTARETTLSWGVKKDFSIVQIPLVGIATMERVELLNLIAPEGQRDNSPGQASATSAALGDNAAKYSSPSPPAAGGEGRGEEGFPNGQFIGSESVNPGRSIGSNPGQNALDSPSDWLYRETITPPCALWIAGAGHIAQAVAPLAAQLDFNVTVLDDRPALASHHYFSREISLKVDIWDKLASLPMPGAPSFGLIVTRGHRHDALVLRDWIHKPFLFLGMIGSARKARTIFDHFLEEKLATSEQLQRVACPVGIRIKSQSVQEIAVSIMAQFIEKRAELVYEKNGPPAARCGLV
jgi:xanthine dehydrogenase accessory factor